MNTYRLIRWLSITFATFVLLTVTLILSVYLLQAPVQAQSGSPGKTIPGLEKSAFPAAPSTLWPAPTFYSIAGINFQPVSSNSYAGWQMGQVGCLQIPTSSGGIFPTPVEFVGRVNLPHGSQITGIEYDYYNPVSTSYTGTLMLMQALWDGSGSTLVTVHASQGASGPHYDVVNNLTINVDNYAYSYYFEWQGLSAAQPGQNLCAARVFYLTPILLGVYMPIVMR